MLPGFIGERGNKFHTGTYYGPKKLNSGHVTGQPFTHYFPSFRRLYALDAKRKAAYLLSNFPGNRRFAHQPGPRDPAYIPESGHRIHNLPAPPAICRGMEYLLARFLVFQASYRD